METKQLGSLNAEEAYDNLIGNDYNWYIVQYVDGSFDCKPRTALSAILDCGRDPAEFDIENLYQCWNGEELGECPW